eukprot:TRINITY_DN386_c0_g1_i2.p1 TRINITY_DN386_c0_g1~~TRINITY_DN386_c0_g1_i2.p1  ORF type:complete len:304 (+),score=49.39 TRINITY_DN386_c0_g1_i2:36-947(+)
MIIQTHTSRTLCSLSDPPSSRGRSLTKKNSTSALSRQFSLGAKIGEGHSCIVKIATSKTGKTVAAKIIEFTNDASISSFHREVEALSVIKHPNIIMMYHHSSTDTQGIIYLQLLRHIVLSDYMSVSGPFPEEQALPLFKQITQAVICVHKNHFTHNDIKPENMMLDIETNEIKLFDFGLSIQVDPNDPMVSFHGGSPLYMAPEVLQPQHDLFMSDIWAMGITFYEMLEGEAPLSYCADLDELITSLPHGSTYFTYPEYLSEEFVCLLRSMLHNDVNCRLRLDQINEYIDQLMDMSAANTTRGT